MSSVGIIGGGIVGMCAALYLRRSGHQVTIFDSGDMRNGCSWGNAGMVVPSHFVPLAAPGMITKGIQWMFNPASPFYIRPRLNADLLRWGWNFYRNSTHEMVERSSPALLELSLFSLKCYQQLATELQFRLHDRGLLMLFRKENTGEEELETVEKAHRLGLGALVLSLSDIHALEPAATINALGGIFFPGDKHLSPSLLMTELRSCLEKDVKLESGKTVKAFKRSRGRITSVETDDGPLTFDHYVLSAGAWSTGMARELGLTLPVEAGKGYSFMVKQDNERISIPTLLLDDRVAVTPMGEEVRFGGTMEIGGIDHSINMRRVQGIVDAIPKYYPKLNVKMPAVNDVWHGLRPCSPDGIPFIGRSKQISNLLIATGHGMMGISLGAGTGRLIADLINELKPEVDLDYFSPDRFS
jgi:D-amino-acid dehydrogenase